MSWHTEHMLIVSGPDRHVKSFKRAHRGRNPISHEDRRCGLDRFNIMAMNPDVEIEGSLERTRIAKEGKGFVTIDFDIHRGGWTIVDWLQYISRIFVDLTFDLYWAYEYDDCKHRFIAVRGDVQHYKIEPLEYCDLPLTPTPPPEE